MPVQCRISRTEAPVVLARMPEVAAAQIRHETVTERMRAWMTEGASRARVGLGRVLGER
jgi:hypothetical protein